MSRALALSLVLGAGLGACSLVVDTGGLSGAGTDASDAAPAPRDELDAATLADASPVDAAALDAADAPEAGVTFATDTFTRPDGPIGNGWIEKSPGTLAIAGHRVVVQSTSRYQRAMVYRPAAEDLSDVEVSIDAVVSTFAGSFPQVHARVQRSTVTRAGTLDSYLLYLHSGPADVRLARTHGTADVQVLATMAPSPPLALGQAFRLRLRVTGASPVKLEAFVERVLEGGATSQLAHHEHLDSAAERIDGAGSVGFSSDTGTDFTYDDFKRTPL